MVVDRQKKVTYKLSIKSSFSVGGNGAARAISIVYGELDTDPVMKLHDVSDSIISSGPLSRLIGLPFSSFLPFSFTQITKTAHAKDEFSTTEAGTWTLNAIGFGQAAPTGGGGVTISLDGAGVGLQGVIAPPVQQANNEDTGQPANIVTDTDSTTITVNSKDDKPTKFVCYTPHPGCASSMLNPRGVSVFLPGPNYHYFYCSECEAHSWVCYCGHVDAWSNMQYLLHNDTNF